MNTIKFIFLFEGRIGRMSFWLGKFALFIVTVLVMGVSAGVFNTQIIGLLWMPVFLWLFIALQAKRWHDLDKTAGLVALNLIPVIGFLGCGLVLGLIEGTTGPNRFGADPLEPPDDGTEESGYGLLNKGTRLERRGRVPEALAVYQQVARRYAHTDAGQDAEKSIRKLQELTGTGVVEMEQQEPKPASSI